MKNADQPAFSLTNYKEIKTDASSNFYAAGGINPMGLTKREYFAAKALQGLIINAFSIADTNEENIKYCVELSVFAADKLIEQLNKKP